MAGLPGRSGGWNRLTSEQHQLRGTYRPDRHAPPKEPPKDSYTPADRRRLLAGLPPEGRRIAISLLKKFTGWDAASLETLRSYVLSCSRLAALQAAAGTDTREIHREIRAQLALLKALELGRES